VPGVSAVAIFAAEDVCAVAPLHSSVELSLWRDESTRLSGD
jgi:hypothetical protein